MADVVKSSLDDKTAIVTGAARGIGFEIAQELAIRGAQIALVDIDLEANELAADKLTSDGYRARSEVLDISNSAAIREMVSRIMTWSGRIDILVNNAGICPITPIEDISEQEWDLVLGINLKGAFLCSQAVTQIMRQQSSGKIINIASSAGQMGGLAVGLHYSASKAGMLGLTKALARILAPDIQVNAVSPGTTESDLTKDWSDDALKSIVNKIPAGRLGHPADVAAAVCFLASREADFITGQTLSVNGGLLMV